MFRTVTTESPQGRSVASASACPVVNVIVTQQLHDRIAFVPRLDGLTEPRRYHIKISFRLHHTPVKPMRFITFSSEMRPPKAEFIVRAIAGLK